MVQNNQIFLVRIMRESTEGLFMKSYDENREQLIETALEMDMVAWTVIQFMNKHNEPWSGTPSKLKLILDEYATQCGWKKADWPKSPGALSNRLTRARGDLKQKNIIVDRAKSGNRIITISKLELSAGQSDPQGTAVDQETEMMASEAEAFDRQFSIDKDKGNVEYEEGEI